MNRLDELPIYESPFSERELMTPFWKLMVFVHEETLGIAIDINRAINDLKKRGSRMKTEALDPKWVIKMQAVRKRAWTVDHQINTFRITRDLSPATTLKGLFSSWRFNLTGNGKMKMELGVTNTTRNTSAQLNVKSSFIKAYTYLQDNNFEEWELSDLLKVYSDYKKMCVDFNHLVSDYNTGRIESAAEGLLAVMFLKRNEYILHELEVRKKDLIKKYGG